MKISERCRKTIERLTDIRNNMEKKGYIEPYGFFMWNKDFEDIIELYTAYISTIYQLEDITKLYNKANDYIDDFEKSEDRCATLEAENKELKEQVIDGLNKERRSLHNTVNILRQENSNQSHEIQKLKKQLNDITKLYNKANDYIDDFEKSEDRCATLEAENKELKEQMKELTYTLNKNNKVIEELKEANDNQFNQIKGLKDKLFTVDEENRKLYEKVGELDTIKKSFDVLRCLYLGDYENDEPF